MKLRLVNGEWYLSHKFTWRHVDSLTHAAKIVMADRINQFAASLEK